MKNGQKQKMHEVQKDKEKMKSDSNKICMALMMKRGTIYIETLLVLATLVPNIVDSKHVNIFEW